VRMCRCSSSSALEKTLDSRLFGNNFAPNGLSPNDSSRFSTMAIERFETCRAVVDSVINLREKKSLEVSFDNLATFQTKLDNCQVLYAEPTSETEFLYTLARAVAAHFSEAGFQGDHRALAVSLSHVSRLTLIEHPLASEIESYIARSSIPLSGRSSPPIPYMVALCYNISVLDLLAGENHIKNVYLLMHLVFYHPPRRHRRHWTWETLPRAKAGLPLKDWAQSQLTVFSFARWAAPMMKAPIVLSRR